ncbi:amine sulfotransferase-like [Ixodes scapularis]
MEHKRRAPLIQLINGIKRSPFLKPSVVREALKYRPRDGDIVLVTYAKGGSHWTQRIIQLLLDREDVPSTYSDFVRRTPVLEYHGAAAVNDMPPPRFFRTHLQLLRNNFNDKAKYVYVARNPWDTCVSLYHYTRRLPKHQFEDGTFDDFFEAFVTGELGFGEYFDHVLHGYARKDDPNVFFMTYEELKADAPGMVLKLAYFLGEEYGNMLEGSEEIFQGVLMKSSFEFMSRVLQPREEEFSAAFENSFSLVDKLSSSGPEGSKDNDFRLFRKGKVNDYHELFSPDQIQRMQARIDKMTEGTDIMSLWNVK